jgi:manganese-dependent inorganic pyrophosphatase
MRVEPVGSTSTIVAKLFLESGIHMPKPIAGVLVSGIVADTLLFRGPTTTSEDRRMAKDLAQYADVDMNELGTRILVLASDVSDRSAAQLLTTDYKDLSVDGSQFGIGVIETTNDSDVLARQNELLTEMARLREHGYTSVLFAIIDIMRERTTLLIQGHEESIAAALGAPLTSAHTIKMHGIVSRKKQLVPRLGVAKRLIEQV